MAGSYTFRRGKPLPKGTYQGYLRARRFMKLLRKQKVMGVCYTELLAPNTYSWESIVNISWK